MVPAREVRGRPGVTPHLAEVAPRGSARYVRFTNGLDFRVLGPLQVAANGTLLPLGGAKQRAVLALLLVHANEVVSSDRLIDELWDGSPPESAANMLQGYVSHLRKTLEPGRVRGEHEVLVSRAPGYMLQIRPNQLDAERFDQMTMEARRLSAEGESAAAAGRFREALALWRGLPLDDFAYEAFAKAEIDRLEELRIQAIEDRIDADLALGRHDALVGELRALVDRYPLRERLRAQLMATLYRCGRQADALEVYREGRGALLDGLGLEPGPALRELERAILRQDPALGAPPPPPRPNGARSRRGWIAVAAVLAAVGLAAVLAFGRSGPAKPVVVKSHSVAVIDPKQNALIDDIPAGGYPGPIAADDEFVYVANIGDATVSRIRPTERKVFDTGSPSRAIDLVAVNGYLWAANGGEAGHAPAPPGTVLEFDLASAAARTIPVGPSRNDSDEAQTTVAASADGTQIWAGNKDSKTVTQLKPSTMAKIHGITPGGLAVAAGSNGSKIVWASDQTQNLVARIDASSKRITAQIPIPGQPTRLADDGRAVWVIARGTDDPHQWAATRNTTPALWRIDAQTAARVGRIPLSLSPIRIALGAGAVWVTAERVLSSDGSTVEATVFRIDPATNRVVASIPLHTRAVDGIVVSHGLVWVAVPPSQ